jgi:hypothetical protein
VQPQYPILMSGLCLHRLMMSRYDSRPFPGPRGTWQSWTPKPWAGDWEKRPDTSCLWIDDLKIRFLGLSSGGTLPSIPLNQA